MLLSASFCLYHPIPSNSISGHRQFLLLGVTWAALHAGRVYFFACLGAGWDVFPVRRLCASMYPQQTLAVCSLCSLFPSVCSLFASVFPPACARLPPLALLFSAAASAPPPGKKPLSWATGDRPEPRELPLESKSSTLICGLLHCNVTISLEEHQPPVNLNPIA